MVAAFSLLLATASLGAELHDRHELLFAPDPQVPDVEAVQLRHTTAAGRPPLHQTPARRHARRKSRVIATRHSAKLRKVAGIRGLPILSLLNVQVLPPAATTLAAVAAVAAVAPAQHVHMQPSQTRAQRLEWLHLHRRRQGLLPS